MCFSNCKKSQSENFVFQHLPVKEEIENPYKNNRLEEINRMRKSIIINTLTSVDIVEIVECGGVIMEVLEVFFRHNLELNPYTESFNVMFENRNLF